MLVSRLISRGGKHCQAIPVNLTKTPRPADTEKEDFENYAANLLSSVAIDSPQVLQNASLSPTLQAAFSPPLLEAPPELRPEMGSHRGTGTVEGFGLEVDEADGCKAAVEIVSRNSQKGEFGFARSFLRGWR